MPRRTQGSSQKTASTPTPAGEQGTGDGLPEHMPQVGEIVELAKEAGLAGSLQTRVYVRILHCENSRRVDVDVCGIRRTIFVSDVLPAEDGYKHKLLVWS